jgi:tRNA-2-methylthio-N6-dimethylallyladenosine synthase
VNSYSTPNGDFPVLLDKVAKVKGIQRVRYTSPHPRDIDKRLLEVMIRHKNICNQVHLPLQAGSDRILKRMNRTYTKQEYLDLVEMIRGYIPDCSLSTDIIVGFPGETQSEFEETLEVVTKVGFTMAFMFKYSPRPGTKAAEYTDQISEDEKQTRLQTLIDLQREISLQRNKLEVGKELDVIIEKESKKSVKQWTGRTESNSWVVFDKNGKCRVGDQVNVKILDAKGVTLFAKLT